jgi:hypothetical protein
MIASDTQSAPRHCPRKALSMLPRSGGNFSPSPTSSTATRPRPPPAVPLALGAEAIIELSHRQDVAGT